MATYPQTEQKGKAQTFVAAAVADPTTFAAAAQTVSDLSAHRLATEQAFEYIKRVEAVGPIMSPLNAISWYYGTSVSEQITDAHTGWDKDATMFNRRVLQAAVHSILIVGLPREWENDGALATETEWEAWFLARWGVAYNASLHEGRIGKAPGTPYGSRPRATVAFYTAMPAADDLLDVLYAPFESTISYASL